MVSTPDDCLLLHVPGNSFRNYLFHHFLWILVRLTGLSFPGSSLFTLRQQNREAVRAPNPGGDQGPVRWGPAQPDLVCSNPAKAGGLEQGDILGDHQLKPFCQSLGTSPSCHKIIKIIESALVIVSASPLTCIPSGLRDLSSLLKHSLTWLSITRNKSYLSFSPWSLGPGDLKIILTCKYWRHWIRHCIPQLFCCPG